MSWRLAELAAACRGELVGDDVTIDAFSTDTRCLSQGSLFVALRGDHFDGHAFVDAAFHAGARAAVVDPKAQGISFPHVRVSDTLRALGDLAAYVRAQRGQVVAITGSNGKTTCKELCAAALGPSVHKTTGNLNNLIGAPLTLLGWPASAPLCVVEMGMNAPGEIARLTEIASPNVGIITNVAPAHLLGLGSVEGVARAKGELFAHLDGGAVAVVNADDVLIEQIAVSMLKSQRQVRFGRSERADVRIVESAQRPEGLCVTLQWDAKRDAVALPLVGSHHAHSVAAAVAAAWTLGVARTAVIEGLARVALPKGRTGVMRDVRVASGKTINVLDDTYNANPGSMRAAFATLAELAPARRRVAALGDMLELGEAAPALHRSIGEAAARAGIACVVATGDFAGATVDGAQSVGAQAVACGNHDALANVLWKYLADGDWLLLKGSRGARMERVLEALGVKGAEGVH